MRRTVGAESQAIRFLGHFCFRGFGVFAGSVPWWDPESELANAANTRKKEETEQAVPSPPRVEFPRQRYAVRYADHPAAATGSAHAVALSSGLRQIGAGGKRIRAASMAVLAEAMKPSSSMAWSMLECPISSRTRPEGLNVR